MASLTIFICIDNGRDVGSHGQSSLWNKEAVKMKVFNCVFRYEIALFLKLESVLKKNVNSENFANSSNSRKHFFSSWETVS